ncbi:dTDP-4-dehydrorhamnose 3,5-epimerase family protein [Candidatus Pseudothioglobus singularis]|nr:dTDP-4-dehydrorhamnose 3,5-epimerase family protein [Candidatus Pseudothioglobus singularis]
MKFLKQKIEGLCLLLPDLHQDDRGIFRRSYCEDEFRDNGIKFNPKQGNISENFKKHTLRGFHYQISPSNESKVISCITGSLYNVVIDLREDSNTRYQWVALEISSIKKESIYVPSGCANAFLTMSDNTIVHYYMGDSFNPESYRGIRYNDSMFSVDWPYNPKIISDKDLNISNYLAD